MKYPDILERFSSYVVIDTQSSDTSADLPSTEKQKDLACQAQNLNSKTLGLKDAQVTEWGYVLASLEGPNQKHEVPTIALIAHMDTSPAVSQSTGVQPQLHKNYPGPRPGPVNK